MIHRSPCSFLAPLTFFFGSYPAFNVVERNHFDTVGIEIKQTSCYFKAKAYANSISNNICHDGPRAGVNQNDGFAGGSTVEGNLILNTVLETGDHGNFNSWDRKPWVWQGATGVEMVPHRFAIRGNFVVRTSYRGPSKNLYCIDHDDGSSMYNDTGNVLVYVGIKHREGLSKLASGNLLLYPNGDDGREVPYADQCLGTGNRYERNTVLTHTGQFYGSCASYNVTDARTHVAIDDNEYYSAGLAFSAGGCGVHGAASANWSAWRAAGLGQDAHSTLRPLTAIADVAVLARARALLGLLPA